MITYDTHTEVYYQIGDPLSHSVACRVCNEVVQANGFNAIILPIELSEADLPRFMENYKLFHAKGIMVTMPHKTRIGRYLDSLDPHSALFHSVNVVTIDENGRTHGTAMDGIGMCMALEERGAVIQGATALILGAGGVSGAVAYELVKRGAKKIIIANRTLKKAQDIAQKLQSSLHAEAEAIPDTDEALDRAAAQSSIVAQCTSRGMYHGGAEFTYLGFLDKMPKNGAVAEAIYNPNPTKFLAYAQNLGLKYADGIQLLCLQTPALLGKMMHRQFSEDSVAITTRAMTEILAGKR